MIEFPQDESLLFIVSGPAGSGKTTLCDGILKTLNPRMQRVITATTRDPRPGEEYGVDYYFLEKDVFKKKLDNDEFYEHAQVHDYFYGSLKEEVCNKLAQNVDLLLNIDIQGAEAFRKASDEDQTIKERVITIFIMPPNIKELQSRLNKRGESDEEIQLRLKTAEKEVGEWAQFDYCIPSTTKDDDFACLLSIYGAEKLKVRQTQV